MQTPALYNACAQWYETPTGQYALTELEVEIEKQLSRVFGYYAVETGALIHTRRFLQLSRVGSHFSVGYGEGDYSLKAEMENLPFDFDSVDLVVASHVLECSAFPHQVLREIDRVVVSQGHCILIGFNPLAFWHSRRSFCAGVKKRNAVKFYPVHRVRDWLSLLGWEVIHSTHIGFRPSFLKGRLFDRARKLEKWGGLYWPIFGNLYVIHARKLDLIMPPRVKEWEPASVLSGKVAINTTPRSAQNRGTR